MLVICRVRERGGMVYYNNFYYLSGVDENSSATFSVCIISAAAAKSVISAPDQTF